MDFTEQRLLCGVPCWATFFKTVLHCISLNYPALIWVALHWQYLDPLSRMQGETTPKLNKFFWGNNQLSLTLCNNVTTQLAKPFIATTLSCTKWIFEPNAYQFSGVTSWPARVILAGSPPNCLMFLSTQDRAKAWTGSLTRELLHFVHTPLAFQACHSPKIENGVDKIFFVFCNPYFWTLFFEELWALNFELWYKS